MSDSAMLEQLAVLNATIESIPVTPGVDDARLEELEAVKRGLDDARLGLWARLQGVHATDAQVFSERFRIRRCLEICTRLTTDLKLGLMPADHPEFSDLWIAVTDLGNAIQAGRDGDKG